MGVCLQVYNPFHQILTSNKIPIPYPKNLYICFLILYLKATLQKMASSKVEPAMTKANKELKSSESPLPEVMKFDAATVTVEELVDALKIAGGVIVRNLLTKDELDQIEADVRPWLEKDIPWDGISRHPPKF
jgi:hypothetical protein